MKNNIAVIRGGGDIASGTIQRLYRCGFKVLILEIEKPTFIRRTVCYGEAVYDGEAVVEGIKAVRIESFDEIKAAWESGIIPVAVDAEGKLIKALKPEIVVDAILAKKNLGTRMDMADITIALGPGFEAGKDVNVVIETMRGHNLGRLIFTGKACENTGIPGEIGGFTKERVIYSHCEGVIKNLREIGDLVKKNEAIAWVGEHEIKASIDGILRGIIRDGIYVKEGLKIADIDPRVIEKENCYTISDKARNIAGGVLEAIMYLRNQQ